MKEGIDVVPFQRKIKSASYPSLVLLHGKYGDYPYLASDETSLIDSYVKIFRFHRDMGYYDESEYDFDSMDDLQLASYAYNRSCQNLEYEIVTTELFLN